MQIKEIREELSKNSKKVYNVFSTDDDDKKTALVVTHLLYRGGAPLVLLEMMNCLADRYNIVLISQRDGDLSKEFTDKGYTIYIGGLDSYVNCNEAVWSSLDVVLLNTIASNELCELFQNKYVPVIWWIHETEMILDYFKETIDSLSMFSENYEILSVSDLTAECIRDYYGIDSKVLHMGIRDEWKPVVKNADKTRFFIPAAFMEIKGIDVIEQAIRLLPEELILQTEFYFAGTVPEDRMYYELIEKLDSDYPDTVFLLGEIDRKSVYKYYESCDCVIAPSRVDATPTTIVEAMMFEKLTICSDACGITHYMNNMEDGLIFSSENVNELLETIVWTINNYQTDECVKIRKSGRTVYLNNFEQKKIESKLLAIIDEKKEQINKSKKETVCCRCDVSVVIPCHNGEAYIARCLDSIINQTCGLEKVEIIVVDDGSTDRSVEIIKQYEETYTDNVMLVCCDISGGAGSARNIGTQYAGGRYITYVDADDMLLPNALSNMVAIADSEDCDWVECGYQHFFDVSDIEKASITDAYKVRILTSTARREELLKTKDRSAPWGKLFNRSFLVNHAIVFPEGLLYEDCFFSQLCYMYANSIVYIDAKYYAYFYNLNGETWSLDKIKNRRDIIKVQESFIQECINRRLITEKLAPYADEIEFIMIKKIMLDSYYLFNPTKTIGRYGFLYEYASHILKDYPSAFKNKYLKSSEDGIEIINLISKITSEEKLAPKEKCMGCGACMQACPNKAIDSYVDAKGFISYSIDSKKCINCGICMEVCPLSNSIEVNSIHDNKGVYAIQAPDNFRMISSSGGIFGIIMTKVISEGGLVAGAVIEHTTGKVKHILSGDSGECIKMLKSKYVQSDTSNVYADVLEKLQDGKLVLFSGTPCQIAGLKSFLRVPYDNLYTCAVVCHGVPSPGVFETYLKEINERVGKESIEVDFRNKEIYGWNSGLSIKYDDCIYSDENDLYMAGFLSDWYLRDACYSCSFKGNSPADIILGDFWGINSWSTFDDGKGTSLVIVNTTNGERLMDECSAFFKKISKAPFDYALWGNPMLISSAHKSLAADAFWGKYMESKNCLPILEEMVEEKHYDVGLVFWWSQNYGNALTNYALSEVVKGMGFSVVAFDNIGLPPLGKFADFAKRYFSLSSSHMPKNNRYYAGKICDKYIVGSDQTWNHPMTQNEGCGNLFYLDWVESNRGKIAYAVSAGDTELLSDSEQTVELFDEFQGIAVRESDIIDALKEKVKKPISYVIDPVFLLDKTEYERILDEMTSREEYIYTYILNPNPQIKEFIIFAEKVLNKKVINVISPYAPKYDENKSKLGLNNIIDGLSVEQWLTLLKNAKYVITDSFHGTCFSIIFEKQFTSFAGVNGESRFETILKMLGNNRNLVYKDDERLNDEILRDGLSEIDYNSVKRSLDSYKKDSINWLKNMLT